MSGLYILGAVLVFAGGIVNATVYKGTTRVFATLIVMFYIFLFVYGALVL